MYLNYLKTLTGFAFMALTACTGVRTISSADTSSAPALINKQHLPVSNKKTSLTGPPEYNPDTVSKVNKPASNKIIEKGGKYVFIPPSYTMLRPEKGIEKYSSETLQQKARKIKKFAAENNYDTAVAFFIDMQVKSGKDRFFVVNLANDSIIKKGLVAHGKGNEKFTFDRKFSNDEGSNCTSLGVYKIGKAYNGAFGLSYKLYGLNKTNNNALKRYVVLHSMGSIPDTESKYPITQTEGCPAVAPVFLEELATILDNAPKNVLLYIYYSGAVN
ncbi:MAG: murein L,D-transpeptidase catalytic domain-containing protein [Chitinophagaceae bacterium]